jgi:hypothetical protein
MTTVSYTAWYDEVIPDVPGCLPAMATNAIRNAAIEFFDKSNAYIYNHAAISAVADTPTYAYVPPTGTVVVKPLQVFYDGREIFPKTADELKSFYPSTDWREETGTPRYFTQDDKTNIRLVPMPDADFADALTLRVSLKPTRASTTIDAGLWEEYLEPIKNGALYRLKVLKNKPFSDPEGAKLCFALFEDGIAKASNDASKGFGRAKRRVRGHWF